MRRKQSNNNNTPWKLSSFCLLVVKMKPQIFRLHHFSSPICSPLMFTPTWVSTWGFLDRVSNQCLDSGKKSQSGFDFIYFPWDGCVVFLTLESFSIFMEYHSWPWESAFVSILFYKTTGKSQTRKQWLTLFGKVTRRTALCCVFIRHSHTVIHKHGKSPDV